MKAVSLHTEHNVNKGPPSSRGDAANLWLTISLPRNQGPLWRGACISFLACRRFSSSKSSDRSLSCSVRKCATTRHSQFVWPLPVPYCLMQENVLVGARCMKLFHSKLGWYYYVLHKLYTRGGVGEQGNNHELKFLYFLKWPTVVVFTIILFLYVFFLFVCFSRIWGSCYISRACRK